MPSSVASRFHRSRPVVPNDLSSAELGQINRRAIAIARVTNVEFAQRAKDEVDRIINGDTTEEKARRDLDAVLASLGYEGGQGVQTLRSDARLKLIIQTQSEQAFGFAQWKDGQSDAILKVWPAQELYRAGSRHVPRDWQARWEAAGGEFFEGRMIALKNDPIWEKISAFGTPYAPFDFNSGMDVRDVERAEAIRFGLLRHDELVTMATRDFADDFATGEPVLDDDLKAELLVELGDGYEFADGVLQHANEMAITHFRDELWLERLRLN